MARYRIVPERSHVWIDARSSLHPIHSTTDGLEGFVDLEFSSDGVVDLSVTPTAKLSLSVVRLQSGNKLEDRELQKRLDSRRYPTIEGVLSAMEAAGDDGIYTVTGDVTLRGVSRRHDDVMEIHAIDDTTVSLTGSSRFDIRQFGMDPPRILILRVEPEVDVRVEIIATKEG